MICPSCKSEVYKTTTFENGRTQCKYCPEKYSPKSLAGLFIKFACGINSNSNRTVAHDRDISRRILAEDGKTVIRI